MAEITVKGIKLHYISAGTGPLVVLLHGFPETSYAWRYQMSELAAHFQVVALDLPGYGQSDKPSSVEFYDTANIAEVIRSFIKALGVEKAHLVGHDWGGVISWKVALLYPEVIDKLAILNAPHPKIMAKKLRSSFKQMLKSWYVFFFQIPHLPEKALSHWTKPILNKILKGTTVKKNVFSDQDIEIYVKALKEPGAIDAAINYYRAAFIKKERPELKNKIKAPTLLIWGEKDLAFSIELTEGMEGLFEKEFILKRIPNASHWVNEELPDVVNRQLLEFLH